MTYQPHLKFIRNFVNKSEAIPTQTDDVKPWLECSDLGIFLHSTSEDWVLIHLITKSYFLNSFLAPNDSVDAFRSKEVLDISDFSLVSSSVGYGYSFAGAEKEYFFDITSKRGPDGSEMHPLFFYRDFDGYKKDDRIYYEILQEYIHFTGLHWVKDKSAFCTLNDVGDLDEKIVIIRENGFSAILFERQELEKYLLCREKFICRFFEIRRAMPNADWTSRPKGTEPEYKCTNDRNSWIRTWPIIDKDLSKSCDLVKISNLILPTRTMDELESKEKIFETFITQDWKHGKIVECSCAPDATDSYFTDTGKPYQTSPVFFKADVLLKYKSDPEKYELNERSIYCRGAWSLQTYDINEEGQVHTYIRYLGYLPHKEQLHWKQYNEQPKGKIADRAFKTDFEAKWSDEYNPLRNIKKHVEGFPSLNTPQGQVAIWKPKDKMENLLGKIHYVSAGKVAEYKDFLLALTILIVDGLDTQTLRTLTQGHQNFNPQMGSLGCLKLLLLQLKIAEDAVEEIMKPLRSLQEKRSKYAGHGGANPDFDLVVDCRSTLEGVDSSLGKIIETIKSSNLNT